MHDVVGNDKVISRGRGNGTPAPVERDAGGWEVFQLVSGPVYRERVPGRSIDLTIQEWWFSRGCF